MQKVSEKAKSALIKGKDGNGKKITVPDRLTHAKSDQISNILNLYKGQISQAIPKHVTAERIIQLATTVISRTPTIKECTTTSIIGAVMQGAILGLDMTPQLGQCFLIPFKNKSNKKPDVQFIIGYKGYIQLMRRSGEISTVYAQVVRENDYFEYELGLKPNIIHKPSPNGGKLTHAYAVIKFKDEGFLFEVLNRSQVMKAKARSQAKNSKFSPWNTEDEEMMWRKTAIRRIQHYAPLAVDFAKAMMTDGAIISPEMFDQEQKQVDISRIEEPDFEVIPQDSENDGTDSEESKDEKSQDERPKGETSKDAKSKDERQQEVKSSEVFLEKSAKLWQLIEDRGFEAQANENLRKMEIDIAMEFVTEEQEELVLNMLRKLATG